MAGRRLPSSRPSGAAAQPGGGQSQGNFLQRGSWLGGVGPGPGPPPPPPGPPPPPPPSLPLLMNSTTTLLRLASPLGSVFATVPAGQSELIGLSSLVTAKPAPSIMRRASSGDLHLTLGIADRLPNAISLVGGVKFCAGLSAIASRSEYSTALLATACGSPRSRSSRLVSGKSVSATMPAMATCLVIATSDAVLLPSVVPVLPATGRPTMPRTSRAVPSSHLPNADWSPRGQRAASMAARATSSRTTERHCGLATSRELPLMSLMSTTGVGVQ